MSDFEAGFLACKEMAARAVEDLDPRPGGSLWSEAIRSAVPTIRALSPTSPAPTQGEPAFDLVAHLHRQRAFSERTFGPGTRTKGVCDHIRKELAEIEAAPADITEWVDVILLAFDGAWRSGATPEQIAAAIAAKQTKNEGRSWPDWRTMSPDKAIEHDRSNDAATGGGGQPADADVLARARDIVAVYPADWETTRLAERLLAEVAHREAAERERDAAIKNGEDALTRVRADAFETDRRCMSAEQRLQQAEAALHQIADEQKVYKGHGDYDVLPMCDADETQRIAYAALSRITGGEG